MLKQSSTILIFISTLLLLSALTACGSVQSTATKSQPAKQSVSTETPTLTPTAQIFKSPITITTKITSEKEEIMDPAPKLPTPAIHPQTDVAPRDDTIQPSAARLAIFDLADSLNVSPSLIGIISEGAWTLDPISCSLNVDMSGNLMPATFKGEHRQIMLSFKDKTYEYWGFRSQGNVVEVYACKTVS